MNTEKKAPQEQVENKALRKTRKQLALSEELATKATKEAYKREQSFNQFIIDLLEDYFKKE